MESWQERNDALNRKRKCDRLRQLQWISKKEIAGEKEMEYTTERQREIARLTEQYAERKGR